MKKILSILIVTLILTGCTVTDNQAINPKNESTILNNPNIDSKTGGEDSMKNNVKKGTNDHELIRIIEQMLLDDDLEDAARKSSMTVEEYIVKNKKNYL